ncbi:LacI family DNA-binding transcriptional regulator [Microbacterium sp.]|uniref:LacI family DNA-binding transcriptional regulator n=1 Tax=Microbacterium sp. TaxID=51671 RepID=UPI0039E4B58D
MERRRRVSILDVAREAGVAQSTASRALADAPRVSPAARRSVKAAAEKLGYVPDLRAGGLASSRTTTIGLLIRGAGRAFYGELAAQVQLETDKRDIDLLIVGAGDDERRQTAAVRNLLGHGVGGILVASGRTSAATAEFAASFVPTVTIALGLVRPGFDAVNIDPASEADLADRVVKAGHTRVAVTASRNRLAHTLHARTSSFLTQLIMADVKTTIIASRAQEGRELREGLRAALDDGVTAFMAGDDATALRILEYLAEWGVRCPDDVSVTGFDGVGPYRSSLLGLTTVAQPVAQLAERAIELIQDRLRNDATDSVDIRIPGHFVRGRTLGAAPA